VSELEFLPPPKVSVHKPSEAIKKISVGVENIYSTVTEIADKDIPAEPAKRE